MTNNSTNAIRVNNTKNVDKNGNNYWKYNAGATFAIIKSPNKYVNHNLSE